jgi:hypothetical protein
MALSHQDHPDTDGNPSIGYNLYAHQLSLSVFWRWFGERFSDLLSIWEPWRPSRCGDEGKHITLARFIVSNMVFKNGMFK